MPKHHHHFDTIDPKRYPLMDIGVIAAQMAAASRDFVNEVAESADNGEVVVYVETEIFDDGIFRVEPAVYVITSEEAADANGFDVYVNITEHELAVVFAASIVSGMLRLGADPVFFITGRSLDDIVFAMHRAVDRKTAATDPSESAAVLRDAVNWVLEGFDDLAAQSASDVSSTLT